jgi:hypothetical protein
VSPTAPGRSGNRGRRRRRPAQRPWNLARRAVFAAVQMHDPVVQATCDLRHDRDLKGPVATTTWSARRFGRRARRRSRHPLAVALVRGCPYLYRQLEVSRVIGQGVRHLIPSRVAVGVARESSARQAVVAGGCEQPERVPAHRQAAPGSAAASLAHLRPTRPSAARAGFRCPPGRAASRSARWDSAADRPRPLRRQPQAAPPWRRGPPRGS